MWMEWLLHVEQRKSMFGHLLLHARSQILVSVLAPIVEVHNPFLLLWGRTTSVRLELLMVLVKVYFTLMTHSGTERTVGQEVLAAS